MFEIVLRLLFGAARSQPEQEPEVKSELNYWARKAAGSRTNNLRTHYTIITGKEL